MATVIVAESVIATLSYRDYFRTMLAFIATSLCSRDSCCSSSQASQCRIELLV
jgi:hypothetical protein